MVLQKKISRLLLIASLLFILPNAISTSEAASGSSSGNCVLNALGKAINFPEDAYAKIRLGKKASNFDEQEYEAFKTKYTDLQTIGKPFPPEGDHNFENAIAYLEVVSKDPKTNTAPDLLARWSKLSKKSQLDLKKPLQALVKNEALEPSDVKAILTQLYFSENNLKGIFSIWKNQQTWIQESVAKRMAEDLQTKSVLAVLKDNHLITDSDAIATLQYLQTHRNYLKDAIGLALGRLPEIDRLGSVAIDLNDPDLIEKLSHAAQFDIRYERIRNVVQSVTFALSVGFVYHHHVEERKKADIENKKRIENTFRPIEAKEQQIQQENNDIAGLMKQL